MKPEFLYHGSQYLFDIVKPNQARGLRDEGGDLYGIYAYEHLEWAIPFALPIRWYPDDPSGKRDFSCIDGKVHIEYGSINPNGYGYVYILKSDSFEKIDKSQWLSRTELIPVKVMQIKVCDYMHTVLFSTKAKEINDILYPKC